MSTRVRMVLVLILAGVTVTCLAVDGPAYYHAVHAAVLAHQKAMPQPPSLLMLTSLFGLAAWLIAVIQQWRRRQFAWIVASFVLSYLAVIAYAAVTLFGSRKIAAHA